LKKFLSLGDAKLDFSKKVAIMGILNLTPDSFYDGGKFCKESSILKRVEEMIEEGADIIDIGGESTRPGAKKVSLEEEAKRVIPVIKKLRKHFKIPISIDTYKSKLAKKALESGANMVNDISGLKFDPQMKKIISKYDVPVVIMHIKGVPQNMQINPEYTDLMGEIISYLKDSIKTAEKEGIDPQKIIIDPGIGFGKTTKNNLEIIRRLPELKKLDKPILIGVSRKSFIGNILRLPLSERLEGSLAANSIAVFQGASIVRTHDIKATRRVADLVKAILEEI